MHYWIGSDALTMRIKVLQFLFCLCIVPSVFAIDLEWNTNILYREHDTQSPFYTGSQTKKDFPRRESHQEISLSTTYKHLNFAVSLNYHDLDGGEAQFEGKIHELYFEKSIYELEISMGKKIVEWGVGFAYRPLDIIQNEDRRKLLSTHDEGRTLISLEYFTSDSAWTFLYLGPDNNESSLANMDEAFAVQFFTLIHSVDFLAILKVSEQHKLESGAGFKSVLNDQWAVYGSFLYQRRYRQYLNQLLDVHTNFPIAAGDPVTLHSRQHGYKYLLGLNWVGISGWSILFETWYDNTARKKKIWQALKNLSHSQQALAESQPALIDAVNANIRASTRYFSADNLLEWNTLLRLSYDFSGQEIYMDYLFTPEDKGTVITLGHRLEGNRYNTEFSLRRFLGPKSAAYALLPQTWFMVFSFNWYF